MLEAYYKSLSEKVPLECKCTTSLFIYSRQMLRYCSEESVEAVTKMCAYNYLFVLIRIVSILWSLLRQDLYNLYIPTLLVIM